MKLTILTPTYNRAGELADLFRSLERQTVSDFEWLIVDDGSTDGTEQAVRGWEKTTELPIRYMYKENGGKHTALNLGIREIDSPLTFIVDSDDELPTDAVETILRYEERYRGRPELCGFSFLRANRSGEVNGMQYSPDELVDTYTNVRINGHDIYADKAEVFYTRCLKEFPFPEYPGERFLGEDTVWIRMARKYKMVHINQVVYICDYLSGGLTMNRRKHNIQSPLGSMNRGLIFMSREIRTVYRMRGCMQYLIYGRFAGYGFGKLVAECPSKPIALLCFIPSALLYADWKRRYMPNDRERTLP